MVDECSAQITQSLAARVLPSADCACIAPRIVSGTLRVHIVVYAGTGRVWVHPVGGAATRRCHAGGASPATRLLRGGGTRHRDRRACARKIRPADLRPP